MESLCAATEKAFGEGGHNRIFHTMGANNSLNGTTKTQIILSGTLQYFTVLVFSFLFFFPVFLSDSLMLMTIVLFNLNYKVA